MLNNLQDEVKSSQDPTQLQQFTRYQNIQAWINQVPAKRLDRVPENEVNWNLRDDDNYGFVLPKQSLALRMFIYRRHLGTRASCPVITL